MTLGQSPPASCICGHPPSAHETWTEHRHTVTCCTNCGCSFYEEDFDR